MINGTELVSKEPPILNATKTVGLISDTHVPKRAHTLPRRVFEVFQKVDYIIHAGDLVELAIVDELEQLAPVLAVHGNMDGMDITGAFPRLNSLRAFDWKIGVMHDPDIAFGFKRMRELVKEHGFNVFVYGHTHVASIRWEGKTLYFNPGSPTVPASVMGKLSVGLLKITKEAIIPEIIPINEV
ncbi:MAG: metallophosphatase family protein [Candidatus Bathyarchaeota archaeon]|nr:metallophosphatase family protein [Candidatus Bathyarchaeota archaeon]